MPVELHSDPFGLGPVVVTVAAWKGGVGKSLYAYELANLLGATLVDADWDAGGVSRQWGYLHEQRLRAPLLDALESGRTPRPLTGVRKPRLIPSHPDFAVSQPAADQFASALTAWARELGPLVVDTHPGGVPSTYGALSAARVVVAPAVLATKELEALEAMVSELPDYPLVIAPNKVASSPPAFELARFEKIVGSLPIAPPVSVHHWLPTRKQRIAVTSYGEATPKRWALLAGELAAVADVVVKEARRNA